MKANPRWLGMLLLSSLCLAVAGCMTNIADQHALAAGKKIAFDRKKGNCLACHMIEGGEEPGNIAQPLVAISTHFKNKAELRDFIWDATQFNTETSMPPFGRNKILTDAELDQLVDYLWSL